MQLQSSSETGAGYDPTSTFANMFHMPDHTPISEFPSVLRFWRDLEFFLPFQLSDVTDRYSESVSLRRGSVKPLPWQDKALYDLNPDKEYSFDVFLAPFALEEVLSVLAKIIPGLSKEELPDPRRFEGSSCFLRVAVDQHGRPHADDLSISTLPWALARLERSDRLSLSEFDLFADSIAQNFEDIAAAEESIPLTISDLERISLSLSEGHPLTFFPNDELAVIVPIITGKKRTPDDGADLQNSDSQIDLSESDSLKKLRSKRKVDILNSFYLRDLERVHQDLAHKKELPPVARHYFCGFPSDAARIDTISDSFKHELLKHFDKDKLPAGRWPSPASQNLGFQQQLAVNHYFNADSPLTAVNGPPGTGKTTLVREILAELITRRAIEISKLGKPDEALEFQCSFCEIGRKTVRFRALKPQFGGLELVVASSNNAAVENISLGLPHLEALGDEFKEFSYLQPTANLLALVRGESTNNDNAEPLPPAVWGFPAVPLGNAANRRRFCRAAFMYDWEEQQKSRQVRIDSGFMTIAEWRERAQSGAISFGEAKRLFRTKLAEFYDWRDTEFRIGDNLQAPVRSKSWQLSAPGADQRGNSLRSELCLAALRLQEAWLRHVTKFDPELKALSTLIRNPGALEPEAAAKLWQLLFMIVPCISSTLASIERMFAGLGTGTIGNVVIEEAGQATPQSVLGLLWRARRAMIIGDQRQLEPVVLTAPALERRLGAHLEADQRRIYSPLTSSAQSLADRAAALGTWFTQDGLLDSRIWVGLPLVIHRRCGSPMFEIANRVAYDNVMLQGMDMPSTAHSVFGHSCWFDVKGTVKGRHWVPEQGKLVARKLNELLKHDSTLLDLFWITPFREVKERLKDLIRRECQKSGLAKEQTRELLRRIGTVHTFQGREADTVFLVLGCDFSTAGAADWAGEKPNLLNVAVTRARRHLYVVGDINVWHNRGYFSDLEKALEKRTEERGKQC